MTVLLLVWLAAALTVPQDQTLAVETLAKRLSVEPSTIRVVKVTPVEWPDASLGCPERGMMYTQAIVPGSKVTLQVDDRQYDVHTGGGRAVMCGSAMPGKPPIAAGAKPALDASSKARAHLAAQRGVKSEDIHIEVVRPWRLTDGECDPPKGQKAPATSYFVTLIGKEPTQHKYRATADLAWPCPAKPPK